jgi:lambda repressor-like predicted transcriptional regulator
VSNQRLRAALSNAGLEAEQLAEAVKVDAKTVERWLAGRTPYTRHRIRVAKVLGVHERDLWPDVGPPVDTAVSDSPWETVAVYPTVESSGVPDWQAMMTTARERIDMLDETLLEIVSVPGIVELLAAKGAAGCRVRILVTSPEGDWVPEFEDDPDYDIDDGKPAEVAVNHARRHLAALIGQPGIYIRRLPHWPAESILRFDDHLLYTQRC